jgi:hypothetical protein
MGKNSAPAIRKPHIACEKQVKMWVNHASKLMTAMTQAMITSSSGDDREDDEACRQPSPRTWVQAEQQAEQREQ